MIAKHIKKGNLGEEKAVEFLKSNGYEILERNWRFKRAEIDIIAKMENTLVIIEVKTRSYNYFGAPESFITKKKEMMLIDAGTEYAVEIGHDWEIRFDIISIIMKNEGNFSLKHYEDAFFPEW